MAKRGRSVDPEAATQRIMRKQLKAARSSDAIRCLASPCQATVEPPAPTIGRERP
jgi:hypothetical protein